MKRITILRLICSFLLIIYTSTVYGISCEEFFAPRELSSPQKEIISTIAQSLAWADSGHGFMRLSSGIDRESVFNQLRSDYVSRRGEKEILRLRPNSPEELLQVIDAVSAMSSKQDNILYLESPSFDIHYENVWKQAWLKAYNRLNFLSNETQKHAFIVFVVPSVVLPSELNAAAVDFYSKRMFNYEIHLY